MAIADPSGRHLSRGQPAVLVGEGMPPLAQYFSRLLTRGGRRVHPCPQRARIVAPKRLLLQIGHF